MPITVVRPADVIANAVFSGEIFGSTDAARFPAVAANLFYISALSANVGNVYIGTSDITLPSSDALATAGLQMPPGRVLGPLAIDDFSRFYYITDNAGDNLTYLGLDI
jgi:hypothetical protein